MSASAALGIALEAVSKAEDFEIPGPAGRIPVRLYVPHTEDSLPPSVPTLVYYHGGGFVAGDLESHDRLLRALANRSRCIVVSAAYRLAPENPYPAGHDDAWAALMWVAAHASDIGADPQRLAVGGDSSGRSPGCIGSAESGERWPGAASSIASLSKPRRYHLEAILEGIRNRRLPRFTRRDDRAVRCVPAPGSQSKGSEGIPSRRDGPGRRCACSIVTADHDPLHDEGEEYAAKLKGANVAVDHTCWPGMVHGLASLAGVLDAGRILIDQTGAALRKAFE